MKTTKRNGLRQHCELVKTHTDACVVDGVVRGLAEEPSTPVPSRPRSRGGGQPAPGPDRKPMWRSLSCLERGCHSPACSGLGRGARAEASIQEKVVRSRQHPWRGGGAARSPLRTSWCPGSAGLPFALCSSGRRDQHSWSGRVPTRTSALLRVHTAR